MGELLLFQNGFNGSSESFGSGIPLISVMDVLDDEFITHETVRGKARLNYEEASRYCVEYGDVLFQRSSENQEDAGTSNVYLDQHVPSAFGGFVIRGKKVDEYNPIFIKYLLGSSFIREQITHRAQGAQHINVSQDTLAGVVLLMPSMREQEAVGLVFLHLANLITLHQRKRRKRLFTHLLVWEQRKLGDVAAVYDGVHQTPDYQDEGVMFLSVENIETLTSQKFISREAFARDYPVYPKRGDVLMTRIGDIGTSNVVETDDKLAFYVSLALLKPLNVDSYYLDKSLQSPSAKMELYRRTLHIAFPKKINKNQIAEVMLPIPRSRQEQEQFGALFRDLDTLITLHQ